MFEDTVSDGDPLLQTPSLLGNVRLGWKWPTVKDTATKNVIVNELKFGVNSKLANSLKL